MQLYEWRERRWLSPSLCERHRSPLTLGGCSELKSVCPKSNQKFQAWGFSLTGSSHLHLSNYFWVPNHSHYYFFYTQAVMILVLNTEPSIHFHCMFLLPAFSQKHSTRYLLSSQFFLVFFGIPVVSDFGKGCHPAMIYRCSLGMLFFPRKLPNFYYIMVYAWFWRLSQECVLYKAPRQIWLLSRSR